MSLKHEDAIQISRYITDKVGITKKVQENDHLKLRYSDQLTAAPQPPQNLSVSNVGEHTADLDWDAPAFGTWDDYTLYIYHVTDDMMGSLDSLGSSQQTVTGLETGEEYEFWVVSVRGGIESAESNHVTANPVDVTAPDPPSNLAVVSSQNEQMDLSWDASPSGDVAGYNVYVDGGGGFTKHNSSLVSGTTYTVDGLTNGQSYDVKVTAVDDFDNESADSNTVTDTVTDTIAPSAPTGLQVDSFTDTTIDISWDANSESDLAGYYVYVDGSKVNGGNLVTGGESHQITGLTQNTQYDIHITAEDDAGNESNSSSTVQQTTQNVAPSAPTGVSATGGDTVIDVAWDTNSEHDLDGYNVYVDGVKDNGAIISGTSYQVTGLNNGQSYDINITAVDTEGAESPQSTTVSTTPSAVTVETKNINSLYFDGNGDIVDMGEPAEYTASQLGNTMSAIVTFKLDSGSLDGTRKWIFGHGSENTNDNFLFRIDQNDHLYVYLDTADHFGIYDTGITPTEEQWHIIAVSYDGATSTANIFYDFEKIATRSDWGGNLTDAIGAPWTLGYRVGTGWDLAGNIDEVQLWNKPLTDNEIKEFGNKILDGNETGLIGYWNCEDRASQLTDLTSNNNHGTISGAVYEYDGFDFDYGLDFDGQDDYCTIDQVWNSFPTNDAPFTLGCSVKLDSVADAQRFVEIGNGGHANNAFGFRIFLNGSGNFMAQIMENGNRYSVESISASVDQWYYVVFTYDGNEMTLYVDGANPVSSTTGSWATDNNTTNIGRQGVDLQGSNDSYLDGIIDRVEVWNMHRTQIEIQRSMGKELAGDESGLVGLWKFDDLTNLSSIVDSTSNGYDGAINGAEYSTDILSYYQGLSFDGVDDYVNLGSSPAILNTIDTNFTISFALQTTQTTAFDVIGTFSGSGSNEGLDIIVNKDETFTDEPNNIQMYLKDSDGLRLRGAMLNPPTITDGNRHTVVIQRDSPSTYKIFIDGVEQDVVYDFSPESPSNFPTSFQYDLYMGAVNNQGTAQRFMDGIIEEMRMWDAVIEDDLDTPLEGNEANLISLWRMDEGVGSTIYDHAGTNHGAINGAVFTPKVGVKL